MKNKIIKIIDNLSEIDENWEKNLSLLQKEIQYIHPDIYEFVQIESSEVIYDKIIGYKPLILDSIKDKILLKEFYNNASNYNEDQYSSEEMIYFLELSFGSFNTDYIYSPSQIEKYREEPFTFEEFYQLWLDKKLK
jgi:hypothetical protein